MQLASGCARYRELGHWWPPRPWRPSATAQRSTEDASSPPGWGTGVNAYGYNYQAHSFNGNYFNSYANTAGFPPYNGDDATYLAANPTVTTFWAWPYRSYDAAMKWNDAWLSNKDCNADGKLDRPDDSGGTYIGSGAWLTNHISWTTTDATGKEMNANEFTKIVAIPVGATIATPIDPYYGELTVYVSGQVMGLQIWGDMAVIQDVLNDKSIGEHGLFVKGQIAAGFGKFMP
jgi:hypothetical protein